MINDLQGDVLLMTHVATDAVMFEKPTCKTHTLSHRFGLKGCYTDNLIDILNPRKFFKDPKTSCLTQCKRYSIAGKVHHRKIQAVKFVERIRI